MPFLLPSNCSCYNLHLPHLDAAKAATLDECSIKRLSLDVRTGAATVLARSGIFVHGGLTIPLNLNQITSTNLQQELIMHFARELNDSSTFQNLSQWISREVFFLDLISRRWERVTTFYADNDEDNDEDDEDDEDDDAGDDQYEGAAETETELQVEAEVETEVNDDEYSFSSLKLSPRLTERLFHAICYCNESLYVFGGLTVSPNSDYEFVATNELWKLDLHTKVWSLVSAEPAVTRRFNCQMHVLYESDAEKDTKLIVVGGLNNMDQPVEDVDVFNLKTHRWESVEVWNNEDDLHDITLNVEGKRTPLVAEKNFSFLVEENEAQLPSLAVYSPSIEESKPQTPTSPSHPNEQPTCNFQSEENPLFALPLMPETEGVRMHVYDVNDMRRKRLHIAYNLQWPTGDKFGYNIIIAGFHPNLQPHNFQCFLYNITSGKWTRLNINCDDLHTSNHRFWKLFLWESHHKALLLGSRSGNGALPSVQKFDKLLSFGLHITNLFHSAQTELKGTRSLSGRKLQNSSTQTETDQFENYSRYVAPPSEITSIRSVFPSYSMVLGKDSLEVYNKLLADFEFITEDNESVAVPGFLLRKRWGRYFDTLLANAYVQITNDSKISEAYKHMSKNPSEKPIPFSGSPHTSASVSSIQKDDKKPNSQGSLDTFFNRHRPSAQSVLSNPPSLHRKSACLFFNTSPIASKSSDNNISSNQSSKYGPDDLTSTAISENLAVGTATSIPDPITSLEEVSEQSSLRRQSTATSGVTSSSGGMVFRVPFRASGESSKKSTPPPVSLDPNEVSDPSKISGSSSNRKNSESSYSAAYSDDYRRSNQSQSRKLSQSTVNDNLLHSSYGFNSPLSSRKASIASTSSSFSHVSSTSDRMGESIYRSASADEVLSLNIALPSPQPAPCEPLPALPSHPPHDFNVAKKSLDHLGIESRYRTSTSPLSSRRSSLHHDISQHISPDSIYHNRIDEVFNGDPLQKTDSKNDGITTPQNERYSFASNADSFNSQHPNNAEVDFEPLFMPRSLYMPWPTETVKAFAEFFYTGQVDGKWPLTPVAVGLLNMAKLYEVPLLFDLMLEVFYSIIGKKEESLFIICKSVKESFLSRVSAAFDEDNEGMEEYLDNLKNYQDFLTVENSLNSIDDGYFDIDHLRKASTAFSVSTVSSNNTQDPNDKLSGVDSPGYVPTVMSGSPRDSINSISSLQYPSTIFGGTSSKKSSISHVQQRINNNPKHKSSLSKEVSTAGSQEEISRPSSSLQIKRESLEMHRIDDELDQVKNLLEEEASGKRKNPDQDDSGYSSDSDDLGVGLGLPSKSKIEKSFRERALELEESVDPLSRTSTEFSFSHSRGNNNLLSGKIRNDPAYNNQRIATLDSLASPNSLPPVDYVMELIYESAVLVSDVKLMMRCMDCLHISKELKKIKRKLIQDITELEETAPKSRKAASNFEIRTDSHENSPAPRYHSHPPSSAPSSSKSFEKITRTISNLTIGSSRSKTNASSK